MIGGWENTRSAIKSDTIAGSQKEIEVDTPGILACLQYRPFWISWEEGTIAFGEGLGPGSYTVASWTDPHFYVVNSVGLSTSDLTHGYWRYFINDRKYIFKI